MGELRQAHHILHPAMEKVVSDYVTKDDAVMHTLGLAIARWKF